MVDLVLLAEDLITLPFGTSNSAWGIYLDGVSVVLADNVVSFEYQNEYSLSTYPQEQGAFQTYDKVNNPFVVRLVFSRGGSLSDRQAFIDAIEALTADLNLYDVVTPEKVYTSCNLFHNSYRRIAQNVGLVSYEIWASQIRVTGSETVGASGTSTNDFQNTASPSGADAINDGNVQTGDASTGDVLSLLGVG